MPSCVQGKCFPDRATVRPPGAHCEYVWDCLVLGTVGCRKGTQFEITVAMPPQGAGQHYAWEHDTVGFQFPKP